MATEDVLHLVFQLELPFFEGDFFELFVRRGNAWRCQFMQAIFKFVMLHSELLEFLIRPAAVTSDPAAVHSCSASWTSIKREFANGGEGRAAALIPR
jgi:hypothetical protein